MGRYTDAMTLAPTFEMETARQLFVWPELPERNGYEMVDGQWEKMAMGNQSLYASSNLLVALRHHGKLDGGHALPNESSVQIWSDSPKTYRKPDGMYFAPGRLPDPIPDDHIHVVPDIVIEAVSKSDKEAHLNERVLAFLGVGVRMVWLLYPNTHTVLVYRPGGALSLLGPGDVLSGEDVLPGFAMPVEAIFEGV